MPSFCVVSNCEFKYVHSPNISFHKFPFHTESLLRKWIRFTDRGEFWFPSRWSSICSRHFLPNDFRDHVSRKCLKRSAVPSVTIKSLDCSSIRLATHIPVENIAICRLCACKSIETSSRIRNIDDPQISAAICKCFPTIRFDVDDILPQKICSECISQLSRFSTYVDQVLSVQTKFQQRSGMGFPMHDIDSDHAAQIGAPNMDMSGNLKDLNSGQKLVKIKQEPLVNVKQEYVDSSRAVSKELENLFVPESDAFCECCDAYFINNIELKKHILTFHPGNDLDHVPGSCEIMEIITLENAFINLAEEDNCLEEEFDVNHSLLPHSDMIPLEQVLKVEHFNEYEQREQMRLMWVILDEHCYSRRNDETDVDLGTFDKTISTGDTTESDLKNEQSFLNISDTEDLYETPTIQLSIETNLQVQCTECLLQFPSQDALDEHITSHLSKSTKTCEICSNSFSTTLKYLIHKQKTHPHSTGSVYQRNAKHFRCLDCSKRFSTKAALNKHKRMMCVMRFRQKPQKSFERRNKINIGESTEIVSDKTLKKANVRAMDCSIINGRYACSLCERTYGRRSNFNRHFILHRPREQWNSKCPHCNKLFDLEHDVAVHIRKQKCSVQKLFVLPSTHVPEHVPDSSSVPDVGRSLALTAISESNLFLCPPIPLVSKPKEREKDKFAANTLSCESCDKRFPCSQDLRQHLKTHQHESKFACSMCDKVFKRVAGLNQHVNGFHLKIKRHTCVVCNYSYALKGDMKRCRHSRLS